MNRKLMILCGLVLAAILFFALDLHDYLSLDTVKARHAELVDLYERRPLIVVGGFMLILVTALTLSIPGSVLSMSLAAGAIFGPWWGTLIVLAALTIGDSLGFLVARYLLRDWVQRRFGRQLAGIERGIDRDGAFYLLSLRLMAVIPFFVVNLTLGLTRMPLKLFAPVSFVGLAPATMLYVRAGTELARIEAPSDIFSPRLIGAFLLLALLPIAARYLFRRRLRSE